MNPITLKYCPGTLAEGYSSYSPGLLRKMFDGRKVSPFLDYESPRTNEQVAEIFIENRSFISISGVQEKLSMVLEKKRLRLSRVGERGAFILKPIPRDLRNVDMVPANEHLTMQIARQVYGIPSAENALVFFKDGTPAYLTKRFDVKEISPEGLVLKWGKEDFASLAGKTSLNAGPNFKYNYSYENMGYLIKQYVPAWRVEMEKFFVLVVFNFLFSNGDAHLKNFSLLESHSGDYLLSPAYDLINTRLHVDDSDFALAKGLFVDDFRSEAWQKTGHASRTDFTEFGRRIGLIESRIDKLIEPFLVRQKAVEILTQRSFLNEASKRGYLHGYNTKRNLLTA